VSELGYFDAKPRQAFRATSLAKLVERANTHRNSVTLLKTLNYLHPTLKDVPSFSMTTPASTPSLISTVPELEAFLSSISSSSTLYLDLEGNCLSQHGTISLITILIHLQRVVRLIDVLAFRKPAFTTASNYSKTLKSTSSSTSQV
jgi:hypothetical protein